MFDRRHMPPPRTNFEKLQDILRKRKGLDIEVSSSGALAASLDLCIVSATLSALITLRIRRDIRIQTNLHSIPLFVLWRLDACFRQNTSAPEVSVETPLAITDLPAQSTPISPVQSVDTLVSISVTHMTVLILHGQIS